MLLKSAQFSILKNPEFRTNPENFHPCIYPAKKVTNANNCERKISGLEKSKCPLIFTSASSYRASETLDDFQCKLTFFPFLPIIFVMQDKCLFEDISRPEIYERN